MAHNYEAEKTKHFKATNVFLWLTHSKKHSPSWEANTSWASQHIIRILFNPKVHYRIHNSPPPAPILSQIDSVHVPHPTSRKSILILSSHLRLGLSSGSLPQVSPLKPFMQLSSPHTCYIPWPSHSSWFNHPNDIWWGVQSIKLFVM
jgi:hypothetical protein